MIRKEVLELKGKKDAKQAKDKHKYTQMHLEEKKKIQIKINTIRDKVKEIRLITTFDLVEQ